MNKDVAKLIRQARKWEGWRVEDRRDGWMLYPPSKELPAVLIHKTPSDYRAWKNTLAQLRRSGAPI